NSTTPTTSRASPDRTTAMLARSSGWVKVIWFRRAIDTGIATATTPGKTIIEIRAASLFLLRDCVFWICSSVHYAVRYGVIMTIKEGTNMVKTRSTVSLAIPVKRALHKLGGDIRDARRRRRIPMALLAERARLSRTTLTKVEKGDSGASVGAYATVLFVLGMTDRLADLADPRHDNVGLALEEERLPQRIRIPRARKPKAAE
ncbi:MAG: hypothetical protein ACHRXM_39610, partial [Isosphaerales bacterium]